MALEGTFKDFPVTDIFQLIDMQKKTGLLGLEAVGRKIRIFFSEGRVIWAEDSLRDPEMRLGILLTSTGKVDKKRLEEALARQKQTRERLGVILLDMGVTSGLDLEKALERQVFETTSQVFRWKEGCYRFTPQRNLDIRERLVEPLPVENLLLDAMRMIDEWPLIERDIPSPDSLLVRSPLLSSKVEMEKLDDEERRVLELVNGTRSVRGIIEASHLSEFDTCKILAGFIRSGILQAKSGPSEVREAESPAVPPQEASREGIPILLSAIALLLLVFSLFALHWDISHLIPFSPLEGKRVALAKVYRAKSEVKAWSEALRRFYAERGNWPNSLEELKTREEGIGLREQDPWGNAYQYQFEEAGFCIISRGKDGIGGTGDDIRGCEA